MQGTRVRTAEDRGPTPVKLERVGWSPARGPYEGWQGWMDGWVDGWAVPYRGCAGRVRWTLTPTLMEQRRAKTSRRPAADQRASSHLPWWVLPLWGPPLFEEARAWLLTWALPTVAVTLRMRWGRRDALQYVYALCRVHADRALRACVALDMPTCQAVPRVPGAVTKNGEGGPAAACEWPHGLTCTSKDQHA